MRDYDVTTNFQAYDRQTNTLVANMSHKRVDSRVFIIYPDGWEMWRDDYCIASGGDNTPDLPQYKDVPRLVRQFR